MDELHRIWQHNKPLVIIGGLGLVFVLYLVYKNATGSGAGGTATAGTTTSSGTTAGTQDGTTNPTGGWGGAFQSIIAGPAGPAGVAGPAGQPGASGPAGTTGAVGPKGPKGPKGKPAPTPKPKSKQSHTTEDHNTPRVHNPAGGVITGPRSFGPVPGKPIQPTQGRRPPSQPTTLPILKNKKLG